MIMRAGPPGDEPPARTRANPANPAATRTTPGAQATPEGSGGSSQSTTTTITSGGTTTVTAGGPGGNPFGGRMPPVTLVAPTELPDYKPPFTGGATRVDAEGNLWIRTSQNVKALPVYNVVNRKGELIDRVQLPAGRVIAGFGAGGSVYLAYRDGDTVRLDKVSVR
jgi:hypothetical protein